MFLLLLVVTCLRLFTAVTATMLSSYGFCGVFDGFSGTFPSLVVSEFRALRLLVCLSMLRLRLINFREPWIRAILVGFTFEFLHLIPQVGDYFYQFTSADAVNVDVSVTLFTAGSQTITAIDGDPYYIGFCDGCSGRCYLRGGFKRDYRDCWCAFQCYSYSI